MARPRKTPFEPQYPPNSRSVVPDDDGVEDVEDESLPLRNNMMQPAIDDPMEGLRGMLNELEGIDGHSGLNIYSLPKVGGPNRSRAFLMSCGLHDYTLGELLTNLQQNYGAGDYIISGTVNGQPKAQRKVTIGPPVTAKTSTAETSGDNGGLKHIGEFLEKSLRQMADNNAQMMAAIFSKLDRPQVDPMEMQKQTIAMLASMRDVFAPPPAALPPPVPQGTGDVFDQVEKLLKLKSLLQSDREPGESTTADSMIEMAKSFLPMLAQAGQAAQPAAQPAQPVARARLPAQAMRVPAPGIPLNQTPTESPAMQKMLQGLETLVEAARHDKDVDLYAELVLDQLGADTVEAFLSAPDALDKLAIFSPQVKVYREWFERLRIAINEYLTADAADSDTSDDTDDGGTPGDSTGSGGDAGDVAGNVETGSGSEETP